MKKILLIVITVVLAVSTSLSLEPMKVGFVYTGAAPVDVRVQLADNVNNAIFVGETFTGVTPNNSGVIIVDVRDHAGSASAWANFQASDVSPFNTLDIYVGTTLFAQFRLDALILAQAQTSVFDNDGNFNPPTNNSSLGTDGNRWSDLFVEGETVHIGPALGMGNGNELAFSYDDATNTAAMTVDNEDVFESTDDLFTFNKRVSQDIGNNNTAFGNSAFNGTSTGISNTAVGYLSLTASTNGDNNAAFGTSSLRNNTSGSQNTAVGVDALSSNTSGISNTAVGYLSLNTNNANNNTAVGTSSLRSNTNGFQNTAIGVGAAEFNTTGNYNTASGAGALFSNTTGNENTANGVDALRNNISGFNNTAIGRSAMYFNNTGSNNTASGVLALFNNTSGNDNTASGKDALRNNTEGDNNTASGVSALRSNTTGFSNTANGRGALQSNTDGNSNTAIGNSALSANTTASQNTAIGSLALFLTSTGQNNTAVGQAALFSNQAGEQNIAIGGTALQATTGSNNTAVGFRAGQAITTGTENVFLGRNAGSTATAQLTTATNSIAIGSGTHTTADNQVVIGNSSITETNLQGLVKISGGADVTGNIKLGNDNDLVMEGQSGILFNTTAPIRVEDDLAVGVSGGADDKFYVSLATGNTTIDGDVTLTNLAGGGTQNIQVDNTGKIVTGGGGGGGNANISRGDVDVSGSTNITLNGGTNRFIKITTATAAFNISGISGGSDGDMLVIYNATGTHEMTITNQDANATAANRIEMAGSSSVTTIGNSGSATFIYDGGASRWLMIGIRL